LQGEYLDKKRCRARIRIRLGHRLTPIVYGALGPEKSMSVPRTESRFTVEDGNMVMELECEDSSALRAGLNTYLRWIEVAKEVGEISENS